MEFLLVINANKEFSVSLIYMKLHSFYLDV
jgi:hypothetical protein